MREASELLRSYGIHKVVGDRYGGAWPQERFLTHGITYEPSQRTASDLYKELLPLINAGRVELLDNQRHGSQLAALERKTTNTGDRISRPPGPVSHDDLANSAAGS